MRVGIPTETKNNEFRVAITPAGVAELTRRGHEVLIQAGAGEGSAITDADFKAAGAQLVGTADQVWADADLLLKVKEPMHPTALPPSPGATTPVPPAPGRPNGWAPRTPSRTAKPSAVVVIRAAQHHFQGVGRRRRPQS